jgi:antitoxin component of RelBE/YafQ-DinJ toxin-antitoxin module
MKNKMINIRIDSELSSEFKKFCERNGYSISKRIRILIKNDINGGRKID